MGNISFFTENISFKLSNPRKTANWLKKVCLTEQRAVESLTYIFCSDKFLLKLNVKFKGHSTYTDILSFDYSEDDKVNGEIYISVQRVRENARNFKEPFERELRRVLVHGVLHFLGYNDQTKAEKEQMRTKEEACLSLWK